MNQPDISPAPPTLSFTNAKSPRPHRILLANIMAIAGLFFCLIGPLAVLLGVAALIITLSLGVWTIPSLFVGLGIVINGLALCILAIWLHRNVHSVANGR